jgi:hypothetical protein
MSLQATRDSLLARRAKYQAALEAALIQPDMLVDKKRTFRTEWIKTLEEAIAAIDEQLTAWRAPYNLRVGVESF